jgi:hypothetical protein
MGYVWKRGEGGGDKDGATVQKKMTWSVLGRSYALFTSHPPNDRFLAFIWSEIKFWIWWKMFSKQFNWSNIREILDRVHLSKWMHALGPVLFTLKKLRCVKAYQWRTQEFLNGEGGGVVEVRESGGFLEAPWGWGVGSRGSPPPRKLTNSYLQKVGFF